MRGSVATRPVSDTVGATHAALERERDEATKVLDGYVDGDRLAAKVRAAVAWSSPTSPVSAPHVRGRRGGRESSWSRAYRERDRKSVV